MTGMTAGQRSAHSACGSVEQFGYRQELKRSLGLFDLVVYGLLVIVPTNNTLMATDPAQANLETRQLIRKWASLHAVRTALGLAATLIFISASLR